MILLPYVAKDAGLSWEFDGTTTKGSARYDLAGKSIRGEVSWFVAPKGRFDPEALYKKDTFRTKEADAAKGFSHVRVPFVFAGMPAIRSDQRYAWEGASVMSRCVYCTQGKRAWVVRFWWPTSLATGGMAADAALKRFKRLKGP